ncbi:hypothetical protein DN069_34325 [Streptacidiphilus pinicola]|uniref:Uncharacterized protein n=1 Tax=Streptacidiphilus pinicola TaxID=2219663 RepID=A0A2X0IUE1_9ACTN|nr:hypothetical protein [Streptacidiphilus pinicola]RAG81176.1 hypothetical protein DN069_34325 [Streptacidiphilus pinicola]
MSSPTPAEPGPEPAAEPDATEAIEATEATSDVPDMPDASVTAESRPRGRTAKIMAAVVALGILGGAGTGYAVQAARKPTPLPPLAATQPAYPSAHRAAPALTASEDDMVKTDGDLTKLLVPIPSGGKPWTTPPSSDGWYDLYSLASNYTKPAAEMKYQLEHGFRRAAVQTWMQGSVSYEVDLIQYRHDKEESTQQFIQDQVQYATTDTNVSMPLTLPHSTAEYGVYAGPKVLHHDDGSSYYRAYGYAAHGDVVVVIYVFSPDRIAPAPLLTLLQNQMERL